MVRKKLKKVAKSVSAVSDIQPDALSLKQVNKEDMVVENTCKVIEE